MLFRSYWSTEKLEELHWEFLYAQVSLEKKLARLKEVRGAVLRDLTAVRASLCEERAVAEESLVFYD